MAAASSPQALQSQLNQAAQDFACSSYDKLLGALDGLRYCSFDWVTPPARDGLLTELASIRAIGLLALPNTLCGDVIRGVSAASDMVRWLAKPTSQRPGLFDDRFTQACDDLKILRNSLENHAIHKRRNALRKPRTVRPPNASREPATSATSQGIAS